MLVTRASQENKSYAQTPMVLYELTQMLHLTALEIVRVFKIFLK